MGKSIRSKVKRAYRSKKREDSTYSALAAARLNRISAKLAAVAGVDRAEKDEDIMEDQNTEQDTNAEHEELDNLGSEAAMDVDTSTLKKVTTHGPRNSRREQWRASKGMVPRPKSKGMSRQGVVAAKRKAGRAKRRR